MLLGRYNKYLSNFDYFEWFYIKFNNIKSNENKILETETLRLNKQSLHGRIVILGIANDF